MKLIGNASYGKTITDVEKHLNVAYCGWLQAEKKIQSSLYCSCSEVTPELWEMLSSKSTVHHKLPHIIGFWVYQNAKLRMLQWHFDFLDHFLHRTQYDLVDVDTDSSYTALAGESIEALVNTQHAWETQEQRNARVGEFDGVKASWLGRTDSPANKKYDKRTPGLFKEEWSGGGFVDLCAKTYTCFQNMHGPLPEGVTRRPEVGDADSRGKNPFSLVRRGVRKRETSIQSARTCIWTSSNRKRPSLVRTWVFAPWTVESSRTTSPVWCLHTCTSSAKSSTTDVPPNPWTSERTE